LELLNTPQRDIAVAEAANWHAEYSDSEALIAHLELMIAAAGGENPERTRLRAQPVGPQALAGCH
jgi:hypothetical protein